MNTVKDREIDEVIRLNDKKIKVIEADGCNGCIFNVLVDSIIDCCKPNYLGHCSCTNRSDNKGIQFIEVENVQYRPYASIKEFLQAQKEHGPYLYMNKENPTYVIPTSVINGGVEFTRLGESVSCGWKLLFDNFTWQDGTSCGKEVLC